MGATFALSQPLVTVVIPTFSRPEMLREAIDSVIRQSYDEIELIISDDSPDTATEELMSTYLSTSRIGKLVYRRNIPSLGAARNFAESVATASGKYVNLLMDDDRLLPTMIETMVALMEGSPSIVFCTSCRTKIDENGNQLGLLPGLEMAVPCDAVLKGVEVGDFCLQRSMNLIGEPSTALFRVDAMSEPFGYMAGRLYGCNVDMATWLRLASVGSVSFTRQVLSETRIHASRQSNTLEMSVLGLTDWLHQVRVGPQFGFLNDQRVDQAAVELVLGRAESLIGQLAAIKNSGSKLAVLRSELLQEMSLLIQSR